MFRQCQCGKKGGSVPPLRSSGIVKWICIECRQTNTTKRTTISSVVVSYRETMLGKHRLKIYLKS